MTSTGTGNDIYYWQLTNYCDCRSLEGSVVDTNTLNLDPDPGFWSNLDTDPGLYFNSERKNLK